MVANVDELWRALARTDELPVEAIEASLANWDQVSTRYLAKLRAQAAGARLSEPDLNSLFMAIHMFAEKRDKRAYAPLCADLAKDFDGDSWLGEAVSETLPGLLINLYDGDPAPLHMLAEAPNADAMARSAALEALGYLTRAEGAMSDEAMRGYLRAFGQNLTDAEDPLIGGIWGLVVGALGYDDLGPEVARAISRNAVDAELYSIKDFHADLRTARDDPAGLAVFLNEGIQPFGSTVEALSDWSWGETEDGEGLEGEFDEDGEPSPTETQAVNPFRDVGRNDPCPCGSGKKFKKCCLAA